VNTEYSAFKTTLNSSVVSYEQKRNACMPITFLPRDATQICYGKSSVCPSVCNVDVPWSHNLEIFENNFTVS